MLPDHPCRPLLVVGAEHLLPGVAQRGMSQVVQQGGAIKNTPLLLEGWILSFELVHRPPGNGKHPKGMGESTRLGSMEGEKRRPELPNSAQALERR